jgi:hypothetical protein
MTTTTDPLAQRAAEIARQARERNAGEIERVRRDMPGTFALVNEFFDVFGRTKGWRINLTENGHSFNYPKEGK